jgi:hypothetical protein
MPPPAPFVNRTHVGILGVVCCAAAIVIALTAPEQEALRAACLRVGLLLGAFWLALPTKSRPAAWANVSPWAVVVIVVALLFVRQMKVFIPLLLVVGLLAFFLRPRPKKRPTQGER